MTPFLKGTSSSAFSMKNTHNQGGKSPNKNKIDFCQFKFSNCVSHKEKNIWYQMQSFKVPVSGKCYKVLLQVKNIIYLL